MNIGLDYVSLAIIVGVYAISQVRSIPLAARYGINAAGFGAIAAYRLATARGSGFNLFFVAGAAALAVFYTYRALQTRRPGA